MRRLLFASVLLLAACGDKQEVSQNSGGDFSPNQVAGRDAIQNVTVNNYQKSQDYQDLLAKRDDARENVQEYPKNAKFRQVLTTAEQNLENFKRDVLKLAEEINQFPLNTERLKQAVALFNAQQYAEARKVLDAGEITQEQDALLEKQQRLQEEQATITAQLDDKANEWLLKAELTAIDYSLGDQRIAQTSSYFEKALKSGRTPDRLFAYALFLQDNNQYRAAENLYNEVLSNYRQLAKGNQAVYCPHIASTLNKLGILLAQNNQRYQDAEKHFREALGIRRQLVEKDSEKHQPRLASTLNSFGTLLAKDTQKHQEAEGYYKEALSIRRELAQADSAKYQSDVAKTLDNLGSLLAKDEQRYKQSEIYYREALGIRRQLVEKEADKYRPSLAETLSNFGALLKDRQQIGEAEKCLTEALYINRQFAKDSPAVYGPSVAKTITRLGTLIAVDSQRRKESENLFTEAVQILRRFAQDNPAEYIPSVANTLMAFGEAYLDWGDPTQALPLLQESAQLFAPLAQQSPGVFGEKHDLVLQLIENAKAAKR